jgi:RNA polymerase sigma factor (sigma-70 family)
MKVFISWSGEPSCSIARSLHKWLPLVVQHVKPWMSNEAIESGTRWNDLVASALNETDFGIVCVTRDNQHKPWLMFEAGALAKRLESARLVPIYFDVSPAEITGPLEAFQGRSLDEEGLKRLVRDISAAREEPLDVEQVDTLFEALWPQLKKMIDEAASQSRPAAAPHRSTQDMLEELVERTRRIERSQSQRASSQVNAGDALRGDRVARFVRYMKISGQGDSSELSGFLDHLTERQREILILRLAVGLSAEETAEAVGSTPGAVRVAQHRALAKLQQVLPDEQDPDDVADET